MTGFKTKFDLESKMSGRWEPVGRFLRSQTAVCHRDDAPEEEWLARYIDDARSLASPRYDVAPTRVIDRDARRVVWTSDESACAVGDPV
jgi:hypothetical protein